MHLSYNLSQAPIATHPRNAPAPISWEVNLAFPFPPGAALTMCPASYCCCIITYESCYPMLILATGYISFPSPFSASHPKAGEGGQPVLLSIPGLNLTSHAPWPFPCSTPEVSGVPEKRVFPFVKEARKNICYSSAWGCLLFHSLSSFFSD